MKLGGTSKALLGVVAATGAMAIPILPASAQANEEQPDAALVALREAAAAGERPADFTSPPEVEPTTVDGRTAAGDARYRYLQSSSTTDGYVEVVGRDNGANDSPGYLTTTFRVYGNTGAFRSGKGSIKLTSKWTCTGAAISGLTVGTGGLSVSGGSTSSSITWNSTRSNDTEVRQAYGEGGHFRCKASNFTPAKTTHQATATAAYKSTDTRAQGSVNWGW